MANLPAEAFALEGVDESVESDLVLLGLIGMIDPSRPEARDTGDHPITADVIASELGVAEGGDRGGDRLNAGRASGPHGLGLGEPATFGAPMGSSEYLEGRPRRKDSR